MVLPTARCQIIVIHVQSKYWRPVRMLPDSILFRSRIRRLSAVQLRPCCTNRRHHRLKHDLHYSGKIFRRPCRPPSITPARATASRKTRRRTSRVRMPEKLGVSTRLSGSSRYFGLNLLHSNRQKITR